MDAEFERFEEEYNKQWDYMFEMYGSTQPWTMNAMKKSAGNSLWNGFRLESVPQHIAVDDISDSRLLSNDILMVWILGRLSHIDGEK